MAKARAIVKRRKAVRNIRKITKTMQMIATAKFQKSLKRAVSTKPYTLKIRELVEELAGSVGGIEHPLLRRPEREELVGRAREATVGSARSTPRMPASSNSRWSELPSPESRAQRTVLARPVSRPIWLLVIRVGRWPTRRNPSASSGW